VAIHVEDLLQRQRQDRETARLPALLMALVSAPERDDPPRIAILDSGDRDLLLLGNRRKRELVQLARDHDAQDIERELRKQLVVKYLAELLSHEETPRIQRQGGEIGRKLCKPRPHPAPSAPVVADEFYRESMEPLKERPTLWIIVSPLQEGGDHDLLRQLVSIKLRDAKPAQRAEHIGVSLTKKVARDEALRSSGGNVARLRRSRGLLVRHIAGLVRTRATFRANHHGPPNK